MDAPCPNCGATFSVTMQDFLDEKVVPCPGCNSDVQLYDQDGEVAKTLKNFDKSFNDLFKGVKGLKIR